jgi:OFA family oxalate/formate antiporter-like MFS transporter
VKTESVIKNNQVIDSHSVSYPWVVVILAPILLLVGYFFNYTFGVFFKPVAETFNWSRATVAGAFSIRSLVAAAFVIPMGYWADRYGPRRVLLPCFALLGVSTMAIAKVTAIWQLYLITGVGIGISMSGPFVCVLATVAKWHDTKRGLALGIASAGVGLSAVVFPPLATYLIQRVDWQFATFILGIIILVVGIPISLFIKDPPTISKQQSSITSNHSRGIWEGWVSIPQFITNPAFLAIVIMFTLTAIAGNIFGSHLVNYATDTGTTAMVAASMMSAMGIASTIGRLGMGFISDRIRPKTDAAICCFLISASFVLLISKNMTLIWMAVVIGGVGWGGTSPLAPALMGERVGIEKLSTATGSANMGMFVGAAIGPWLAGVIFDVSQNYLWAFILAIGVSITALIIALCMPPAKLNIILKK